MKVYISGKITGKFDYRKKFKRAENKLIKLGHSVLNPATMPIGLNYDDYMHISYAMIDCADCLYMLDNWKDSKGARLEFEYATVRNKKIFLEVDKI